MSREPWDKIAARAVVRPLARLGVHPNAVTATGLCLGLLAAYLLADGGSGPANIGAGVFVVALLTDHVDGELARSSGRTSRFGHIFDHVAASTTMVTVFAGIGIGQSKTEFGDWGMVLGLIAGSSVALTFFLRVWLEERHGKDMVEQDNFAGFEIEDALYIVGPAVWLGGIQILLVAAAIGAPLFLAFTLWQTCRGRNVTSLRRF